MPPSSSKTLYGTTWVGTYDETGSVYAVAPDGSGYTTLHLFSVGDYDSDRGLWTNYEGYEPVATLISDGTTLYGTAVTGGANGNGTVFAISTTGSIRTVYPFSHYCLDISS
jgi:uncharacterized repeat protein (TIGR03803 family)